MSTGDPDLGAFDGPVCVTGGSGFIGSHVVRRLLELGRDVRCLVMAGDDAPALDGLNVVRVTGDLLSREGLDRAMEGCDLVIHLAAIYALWLPDPEVMHRVNVDGTREVLCAARRAGVKRVVHTSSIAAIGYVPGTTSADESAIFDQWELADPYVMSKVLSEREAMRALYRDDMDVVVVNPAFPFGARDIGPTPTGNLILSLMRGELPFVMKGGFNAVDVNDVAEGHLLAAARGRSGERYLLGGHNLTYADFGAQIASLCGGRAPLLSLPRALMLRLGAAADLAANVIRKPPLFTQQSIAMTAGRFLYFDTTKARTELGYMPGPLEVAFKDAISWFKGPENNHDPRHIAARLRSRFSL